MASKLQIRQERGTVSNFSSCLGTYSQTKLIISFAPICAQVDLLKSFLVGKVSANIDWQKMDYPTTFGNYLRLQNTICS